MAFYHKFQKRVKNYKLSLNSLNTGRCHQFDGLLKLNMLVILEQQTWASERERRREKDIKILKDIINR